MLDVFKTAYITSGPEGYSGSVKLFSPNGDEIPCIVSFDIDKIDGDSFTVLATIVLTVSFGKET
jgi:hypothetical protein